MNSTIEVRAPSEQSEGTRSQVQRWLKSVGDEVAENEPLIEVETDKVTIEIPAPGSGVLQEILKQEQEEIAPGELLAVIRTHGDVQPAAEAPTQTPSAPAPKAAQADAGVRTVAAAAHADALSAGRSSPAVRRLLAEHGVDAAAVRGTGAGGRITVDDVLDHVAQRTAVASDLKDDETGVAVRRTPHSSVRKRIAARMVESLLHTAPHVTTVFEADMRAVLTHRARHRASFEQRGASLTLTSYFLAACVDAILEVPEANSRWTADALLLHETIDIGVGTAIEGKGLVVPVVRNVQSLDLFEISRELGELVRRAREDKLTPADVRGGTFTISNHGVSGSLVATPIIINQPQSRDSGRRQAGKARRRRYRE